MFSGRVTLYPNPLEFSAPANTPAFLKVSFPEGLEYSEAV